MLVLAFLFAVTAVSVSAVLVVYTARRQHLKDGLFALAFAVLSARAVFSWAIWHDSDQRKPDS